MKIYFYLLAFLPSLVYTQNDSLKELLNYYPLHTGNCWEYLSYWQQIPFPPSDSSITSFEVLGDTLLENGHTYKLLGIKEIIPHQYQYSRFERIDSLTGCVYRYINDSTANHEYMSDSLFAEMDDIIYSSRERITTFGDRITRCVSVTYDSVFGVSTQLKTFQNESFIPGETYTLAKGFGDVYGSVCEMGCGYSNLRYAKINGKEYGKKITSINSNEKFSPNSFILYQNYPNPFNPSTVISFQLPMSSRVSLIIYDVLGKEIAVLVNEEKQAGNYKIDFNGNNLASGIYFYTLRANNVVQNRKMILLK